jgi:hypothetical protein
VSTWIPTWLPIPDLSEQVERRRKLHLWRNRFWTGVGLLGILLLILLSQIPVF